MKTIDIVCGIIKKDNKFVIARRGVGVHENIWEFPGGKVEQQETYETAVKREILEELNIEVEVIRHVTSIIDKRENSILHVHAYLCKYTQGDIQRSVHHEVKCVSAAELTQYTFEPADAPMISAVQAMDNITHM